MVVRPPFAVATELAAGVVDVRGGVKGGPALFRRAPLDCLTQLGLDAKSLSVTVCIHQGRARRPLHWTERGDPSAGLNEIRREQPTLGRTGLARLHPVHRAWRGQPRLQPVVALTVCQVAIVRVACQAHSRILLVGRG